MIDQTHDPERKSWVHSANDPDTEFPIQNLPFATFRLRGEERTGVAIGSEVLDASAAFGCPSLSEIMSWGGVERSALRFRISEFLLDHSPGAERFLHPISDVELLLPCTIGDYTDFYASIDHATNVGRMFRPDSPLFPNYKWLPVGYHGRASSIVVSGTPVRRPWGQIAGVPDGPPEFAPTRRLDYEVEIGAFVGGASNPDHLFGLCLLNDWSARDIQTWEAQPLGPFLSKNFATTISPWIVTAEALEPFRCAPAPRPDGDPQPLPYLQENHGRGAYSIQLEAWLRPRGAINPLRLSQTNFASMYWTLGQMLTHHASNGCPLRPGDLIGSGTVSGPQKENRGCLLELTWRGAEPLRLPDGQTRTFLEDGDEVILRGRCQAPGFRSIGWGDCTGTILPAKPAD